MCKTSIRSMRAHGIYTKPFAFKNIDYAQHIT